MVLEIFPDQNDPHSIYEEVEALFPGTGLRTLKDRWLEDNLPNVPFQGEVHLQGKYIPVENLDNPDLFGSYGDDTTAEAPIAPVEDC